MREKYFCPNCSALITTGERFCGNCGTALRWVIPQVLTQISDTSNSSQTTAGRQLQKAGHPADGDNADNSEKTSSVRTLAPLSAEIARLLAGFEKQLREQRSNQSGVTGSTANTN
jgi:hypothetical protein